MRNFLLCLLSAFMAAALTSCAVMSKFDQNAYDSALSLKSESLALVSNASQPATPYIQEIEALKVKLSAQLAYQQGKGKRNAISAKQWDILVSPEHDLLGYVLKKWPEKEFSKAYVIEKNQQISDGFDQIIRLEGAKNR